MTNEEIETLNKEIKRLQKMIEDKNKEIADINIKNGLNKHGEKYYDTTEWGQKRYVDAHGNLEDIEGNFISCCDSPRYKEDVARHEYENNPANFTLEQRIKKLEAIEFWRDREETM